MSLQELLDLAIGGEGVRLDLAAIRDRMSAHTQRQRTG